MNKRRLISLICLLALLVTLTLSVPVQADQTDTVYVRKHISLVYDNSGSMSQAISGVDNLKWCYASYAAQVFTGLLNETDSLSITFMNNLKVKQLTLDLSANRQTQVEKVLDATDTARSGTPFSSVNDALNVLIQQGLLSDAQLGSAEVDEGEQFWLVLTTDGRFNDDRGNSYRENDVVSSLANILDEYSNLQVVYFGIGTRGDTSNQSALDFRSNATLTAYPNFSAYYAEDQDQIVSTMQEMSNRISGRYDVSEDIAVSGKTVTIRISGESSPIRNVAVLAQQTNAKLVSAVAEDGTTLQVSRSATIAYPYNRNYDNVPTGTLGGCTAMITSPTGKIPEGSVTLTFSENITADSLSLMYEPAIYVRLNVQKQDSSGKWNDVALGSKVSAGDTLRLQYDICEDGSDSALDASRLPGRSEAEFTCGDKVIQAGEAFTIPPGNTTITASVSLMDGAYRISTSRTIQAVDISDYKVTVSKPLTILDTELATNTQQHIDFTVKLGNTPADAAELAGFRLDAGALQGTASQPGGGVLRFTPKHSGCKPGDYTITLYYGSTVMASQTVTVNTTTYSATASGDLSLVSDRLDSNTQAVTFRVTVHQGKESHALTQTESDGFRVEAKAANGTVLNGTESFRNGSFTFTPNDPQTPAGDYTVTLYQGDSALAKAKVTVLPVTYSATASGDLSLVNDQLDRNAEAVSFKVTVHRGSDSDTLTEAESSAFRVAAKAADGTVLNGTVAFRNGSFTFTPNDPNTPVGDYTVTLYHENTTLAQAKVTILPVTYSAAADRNLEIVDVKLEENTEAITFRITAQRDGDTKPITEAEAALFTVSAAAADGSKLNGTVRYENGSLVFTPGGTAALGEYTVSVVYESATLAQAKVTIIPDPVTYTAEADRELTLFSNAVSGNQESIVFAVTAHRESGDTPITQEESGKFRLEAVSADGAILDGSTVFADGSFIFTPDDDNAPVGSYTVTLYQGDMELAHSTVTILQYNAQYVVEAHVPDEIAVQRFNLIENQTAVRFVIFADGIPCSQEQLRSMLQEMIHVTQEPGSPLMDLEITVGTHDGIPAVVVRPASWTDNSILDFLSRPFAALGLVPAGDLALTLEVDAPKGDSATGSLEIVFTMAELIFYLALLAVIIVILALVFMLIYSNLRMPRIRPGYLLYYSVTCVNGQYYVSKRDKLKLSHKFYFRLLPTPETVRFRGRTFTAGTPGYGFQLLNLTLPKCTVKEKKKEISKFYVCAATPMAKQLLTTLRTTVAGSVSRSSIDPLLPKIAVIPTPTGKQADAMDTHTFLMSDGGYILQKDLSLEFWAYTSEKKKNKK